jgi:hypothetical protein
VRSARLFTGGAGALALSYVTARPGERIVPPAGDGPSTMRATEDYAHFVAGMDALKFAVGATQRVVEPGVVYHDGGWVGSQLLVVHGRVTPAVSVFGTPG